MAKYCNGKGIPGKRGAPGEIQRTASKTTKIVDVPLEGTTKKKSSAKKDAD